MRSGYRHERVRLQRSPRRHPGAVRRRQRRHRLRRLLLDGPDRPRRRQQSLRRRRLRGVRFRDRRGWRERPGHPRRLSDAGTTTGGARFFGEGGNDTLQGYEGNDDIHGGEGTDIIDGGSGNDGLFGDGGNDEISGRAGNDNEDGGPGDDSMGLSRAACCGEDDDQGADSVRGGAGTDTLTLEDHSGGMTINLDDQANDGTLG